VPGWINEKKEGVSINKVLWSAAIVSFVCNLVIGLLGAWCYPKLDSDDLLQYLSESGPLTRITTYLYTFAVITSSTSFKDVYYRHLELDLKIPPKFVFHL
jgi:amino acid permease